MLVVDGYCYADHNIAISVFNSMHDRFFPISAYAYGQVRAVDINGNLSVQVSNINGSYQQLFASGNSLPSCLTEGPLNSIVYGIDWSVVEWIFGAGLIIFATGAAIGSIINVVRKTRV